MIDSATIDSATIDSVTIDSVIFDLGGVVLGWEPALAYADVLPPEQIEAFMTKIDFATWNAGHDAGRAYADGEAELAARFPDDAAAIGAYRANFARTLTGTVPGTGAVIAELARAGVALVALTNWSAETFPHARERFGLLRRFAGIVVSGQELVAKPDPAIFALACERYGLDPARTAFVDDSPRNVAAATAAGLTGIEFVGAEALRATLEALGVLGTRTELDGPIHHLAVAADWAGEAYPWSTRGVTYDAEGYVHCSFPAQVAGVRARYYGDLPDEDLLLLELDLSVAAPLLVAEDLGVGEPYPHLYAPLTADLVRAVAPL